MGCAGGEDQEYAMIPCLSFFLFWFSFSRGMAWFDVCLWETFVIVTRYFLHCMLLSYLLYSRSFVLVYTKSLLVVGDSLSRICKASPKLGFADCINTSLLVVHDDQENRRLFCMRSTLPFRLSALSAFRCPLSILDMRSRMSACVIISTS